MLPEPQHGRAYLAAAALLRRMRLVALGTARTAVSPAVIVCLLLLLASACAVYGCFLLVGFAWALVAAAVLQFGLAALLMRGAAGG